MDRTGAERQRRYMAKLKAAARAGNAMIATLQARIDELEKDLRAADNLQVWANGSRSGITRR